MAFQNSNAIAVTGGTIAGITSTNLTNTNMQSGGTFNHTGQTFYITPSTGVYALWINGANNNYAMILRSGTGSPAHGAAFQVGSVATDIAFTVANRAVNRTSLVIWETK